MFNLRRNFGLGSLVVILITLVLFVAALLVKGYTHDLLLESAVFLVLVKLILLSYRNSQGVESIQRKLDMIRTEERHLERLLAASRNAHPIPKISQALINCR
jgi:hypothetical protein